MNTTTFRTNLKTLLDARPGLDATVEKYPPGNRGTSAPTLFIGTISVENTDGTLLPSSTLDRTYTVNGGGWAGGAGASDAKWAAAETIVNTMMTELEAQCVEDQTINGICTQARLLRWESGVTQEPDGSVYFGVDWVLNIRDIS